MRRCIPRHHPTLLVAGDMHIRQRRRKERMISQYRLTSVPPYTTPIKFRAMREHVLLDRMQHVGLFLSTLVGEDEPVESGLADG
jgi:hypothetical protein